MASALTYVKRFLTTINGPAAGDARTAASVRSPLSDILGGVVWLKEQVADKLFGAEKRITNVSGNVMTITGHGYSDNDAVRVFATSSGALPAGLSADTVYYVNAIDANTFTLSATSGPGADVTLTTAGTDDIWVQKLADLGSNLMFADATYGAGKFKNLVMWLAGAQTIAGAKVFTNITVGGTSRVGLTPRTRTRILGGKLHVDGVSAPVLPTQLAVDAYASFDLDLPHASTINAIRIHVSPDTHVALPGTMPAWELISYTANGTAAPLTSMTDASVDAAAYSASHFIEKTGLSINIDRDTYRYRLNFVQESGGNSAPGDLNGGSIDITVSVYDDATV